MQYRFSAILCFLLLGACSTAPIPTAKEQPAAAPVVYAPAPAPPRPAGDWIDWPIAKGNWVYRQDDRGSIALFGSMGGDAIVTLRCDIAAKKLYLARASNSGSARMLIRTRSAKKEYQAYPTGGIPRYVASEIAPSDNFLDAIIYTRGRIAIETDGAPAIAIPIWSEIPKVIEDCR